MALALLAGPVGDVALKLACTFGIAWAALRKQKRQEMEVLMRKEGGGKDSRENREPEGPETTGRGAAVSVEQQKHKPPFLAGSRPTMGDLHFVETVVNALTCAPYFLMARTVPSSYGIWARLFSKSCSVSGLCALLYHISAGPIRHFFRRLDYMALASSSVLLTCARSVRKPVLATAVSALLMPFQPVAVAGAHMLALEVAFLRRALLDPKLRAVHFKHTSTGMAAFLAFYADDLLPQVPYLHATWHCLSAYATHLSCCLVVPSP